MQIGYVTPNSWGIEDPRQVVDLAVRAEQIGVHSLWVSHHVLHAGFVAERLGRRPYHDPLTMLAVMATATERARLGTSVLVLPYLHPMPTAKALATVDHLCGGRLEVGVGVGGLRVEHDAVGRVPFEERGRYADEFLEVLELLWSGRRGSFSGRYFAFADTAAYPGPVRRGGMPLLVGGRSSAALRRAVRFGTGWQGTGLEPADAADVRDRILEGLAAAGRSADEFPFQVRLHIAVDDLDEEAWRDRVSAYEAVGVGELVLAPQSGDVDLHRRWLDAVAGPLCA